MPRSYSADSLERSALVYADIRSPKSYGDRGYATLLYTTKLHGLVQQTYQLVPQGIPLRVATKRALLTPASSETMSVASSYSTKSAQADEYSAPAGRELPRRDLSTAATSAYHRAAIATYQRPAEVCRDFIKGICRNTNCTYRHDEALKPQSAFFDFCKDYMLHDRCINMHCQQVHADFEMVSSFKRSRTISTPLAAKIAAISSATHIDGLQIRGPHRRCKHNRECSLWHIDREFERSERLKEIERMQRDQ
jgi:hypothetical protein